MGNLKYKTVQQTIEGLERQLEGIFYHFELALKEMRNLKLLLDKQKLDKKEANPHSRKQIVCELMRSSEECGCF